MDNYEFCARWVAQHAFTSGHSPTVLDYGCGNGQIVSSLRANTFDAYGCDVFYEGGDYSNSVPKELFGTFVLRMSPEGHIPFGDGSFDLVVSNQVLEHVEHLDKVLSEISRVLRPGGKFLFLFPDISVWREGHCGIPFLHWFPKGRLRVRYAMALSSLGLGYHKQGKSRRQWAEDFCLWLDQWTHYRAAADLYDAFMVEFVAFKHIEDEYLQARLGRLSWLCRFVPSGSQKLFVRKMAGIVGVAEKM